MAAKQKHPFVPDQIRKLALAAKRKGLSFDEFWSSAMPVRLCPECGAESLRPTCDALLDPAVPEAGECGARTRGPAPVTFDGRRGGRAAVGDGVPEGFEYQFVVWPSDSSERRAWLDAVSSAREGWRAAYDGAPADPRHRALTLLAEGLRQIDEAEPGGFERSMAVA